MCGIVAMISRRPVGFIHQDLQIMQNLLVLDTFRGLDSTGAFVVERNKNVQMMKIASHPYHLFATDDWDKFRSKAVNTGRIVVGHNRKATQGAINSNNAHPFHENNIVLVHNGTLRGGHKELADVEVDSHAVCHAFNEKGARNVIPTIDGAFAFVWWDIEKEKLYAIRNDERPLSIVVTDEVVYLASEPWMVNIAAGREGRKVKEVIDLTPGQLYEFDHMTGDFTKETIDLLPVPTYSTALPEHGRDMSKKAGGALQVIKQTNSPAQVETQKSVGTHAVADEADLPDLRGVPHTVNLDFPRGQEILVKLANFTLSGDKKYYVGKGKSIQPGVPPIDIIAHMSAAKTTPQDLARWFEGPIVGRIAVYMHPAGGPSAYVRGLRLSDMVKIHNGEVTKTEWERVITNCKCHKCLARIYDEESPFTIVTRATQNDLQVTCADCVEDKLTGEAKNAFNQRRSDAIQAAIELGHKAANGADDIPPSAGAPTLH